MKGITLKLISAVVFGSAALSAQAAEYELLLGYSPLKGTTYDDVSQQIQERILEATAGRVKITANSSLLSGSQLAPGVRDGQIDMALIVPAYYAATQPILGTLALPGLVTSLEDYRALMEGVLGDEINNMWGDDYNSLVMMDPAFCAQNLLSTGPVRTVEDFRGQKLRVHNPETGRLVAQVGAKPTSLPAPEVLPGLQQGVIDGVFTAGCWALGAGFASVIDNATQWRVASYLPWTLLMSKDSFDELPQDLQQTLQSELAAWQQEIYDNYDARAAEHQQRWKELGVEYHVASDEEVEQLMQDRYTRPVYDTWFRVAEDSGLDGKAIVEQAREVLQNQ